MAIGQQEIVECDKCHSIQKKDGAKYVQITGSIEVVKPPTWGLRNRGEENPFDMFPVLKEGSKPNSKTLCFGCFCGLGAILEP